MATLTDVPPVAVLLTHGSCLWAEEMYFLGIGSKPKHSLGHGVHNI